MGTVITSFYKFFNNIYFVSVFTFISILFFFSGIFFGLDFTDSFYHLNQALIPPDGVILYPILLSSLIIKGVVEIFGPHLIVLRFINASIFFISAIIPFLFLKTRASTKKKLFFIGCVLFLVAPLNANVLGYDSFSIFFNSLVFAATLLYFKKKNFYSLVILAIFCSMSILVRLPNSLVLPIVMFLIFYHERLLSSRFHVSQIKMPFLFLFLALLGVSLGYGLYYREWEIFVNASMGTISHDLKLLFYRYIRDGIKLVVFFSFITGSYYLFKKISRRRGEFVAYGVNLLLYIAFIILFLFSGYSYTIFLTALVISIAVIHLYGKSEKSEVSDILILTGFTAFLFINPFGSNLGLLKASFLFLLLAYVLSAVPVRAVNFWKSILIIIIPFAVIGKFFRTYEDGNIFSLNKTLKIELLNPIKTSEERFVYINQVEEKVKELQSANVSVFFYGDKSHIFHYLYPDTTLDIKAFEQPVENLIFLSQIEDEVRSKQKVAIFLVNSYPESNENTENVIEEELFKKGFKKVQEGSLEFLYKSEDENL